MIRSHRGIGAALTGAALVLGTAAAAAPASAATVRPMTSWIGACHPWNDNRTVGGWCDGNGPNWTYNASGVCTNGKTEWGAYGVTRWAGDRRGSYAYCSTRGGYYISGSGVLNVYYNGVFQWAVPA
jgi:hypothetical protein